MESRQRQVMDAFVRVQTFLDENPATGVLSYASAREMLEDVLTRLRAFASTRFRGRDASRAERVRQSEQAEVLMAQYVRPIVTIARSQIEPTSDVGLPAGLRMPKGTLTVSTLVTLCDGMIEAAREHEAVFVANGLPADFLAQFTIARNTLERLTSGRAAQKGAHVAAREGLQVQLRRGRRAVERLDALVRASFRRDPATLAAWRAAKRVQRTPGGAGARISAAASDASSVVRETVHEQVPQELAQAA